MMNSNAQQKSYWKDDSGQIFVEYILLLLIAISTAVIINKILVSDAEDIRDAGLLRKQWFQILTIIAKDKQN